MPRAARRCCGTGVLGSRLDGHALVRIQNSPLLRSRRESPAESGERLRIPDVADDSRRERDDAAIAMHMARRVAWCTRADGQQDAEDAQAREESGGRYHGHTPQRRELLAGRSSYGWVRAGATRSLDRYRLGPLRFTDR